MSRSLHTSARLPAKIEWPTVILIAVCYATWFGAGIWLSASLPLTALLVLILVVALQSSLMHEASHGHPTRSKAWNELLVGLPIGLVYPYRRFRSLHLRHHADEHLTDPFDDPESYYKALWHHEKLPKWLATLLTVNNTMVGRFLLGPLLANAAFFATEAKLLKANERGIRRAWAHHMLGLAVVVPIVCLAFALPVWAYLVAVYLGQSLIAIRTFAEHQWSERPDGRTVIVERSPLALLFLNNNLHLVHHKSPTVAWYRLPELYRVRRDEWLRMSNGYVFPNYFALLKSYAFKAKEPVVHPFLRRSPELGRAFRPRIRSRASLHGAGTAPIPAKPPKD